jgi:hypothetical protein
MLQVLISFLLVFFGFCAVMIITAITTVFSLGNKHLNLADEGGNARLGDFGVEMRCFSGLNHNFGFVLCGFTVCFYTFTDSTVHLDLFKSSLCSREVFLLGFSFLVVFTNLKLCFCLLHLLIGLRDKLLNLFQFLNEFFIEGIFSIDISITRVESSFSSSFSLLDCHFEMGLQCFEFTFISYGVIMSL